MYIVGGEHSKITNNIVNNCNDFVLNSNGPSKSICGGIYIESTVAYPAKNLIFDGNQIIKCGNLVKYGMVETDAGAPWLYWEAAHSDNGNVTSSQDSGQAYSDTNSRKIAITATGTDAYWRLADGGATNDMHDFLAGETYIYEAYIYVPSSGGPQVTEVHLGFAEYYSAAWHYTETEPTGQDAWEKIEQEITLNADCDGFYPYIKIDSAAANGEYVYVDDHRITMVEQSNYYEHNLFFEESSDGEGFIN
jgi:hypothetical protein